VAGQATERIVIKGLDELRQQFKKIEDDTTRVGLYRALKGEFLQAADVTAGAARGFVSSGRTGNNPWYPNRPSSGRLAGSIKAKATNRGAVVSAGNARVRYAGPINYGWGSRPNKAKGWRGGPIAANNFLQKGVQRSEPRIRQIIGEGVRRLTEQVTGRG
jgi:phage gpG-like protein